MTADFTPRLPAHTRPPAANAAARFRGFTLIELLTVIAIIGILAAILIPTVAAVRESARRSLCASNVRQLVLACHVFAEDHGVFPPAETTSFPITVGGRTREVQANWLMILADGGYVDQRAEIGSQPLIGGPQADTLFMCPTATRYRTLREDSAATYGINAIVSGDDIGGTPNVRNMEQARDASLTAMIMDGHWDGTRYITRVQTAAGRISPPDYVHPPGSANEDGAGINVGFVDGHVAFLRKAGIEGKESDDIFWTGL